uniref:hypothetical protein n=1 Tax=Marinobacterium profundum TaxID=1714300 RepID=UPI00082B6360|nr:hypothetical protein [Marinobacterium profundum]
MSTNATIKTAFETVQSLVELQTSTISQSIELQKKSGEELAAFFKANADKAKTLKTPQDLVTFNMDSSKALFELLKAQGEAFSGLATKASEAATAKLVK